jgi:hypothetical protein
MYRSVVTNQNFMRGLVYPNFWVSAAISSLVIFVQTTLNLPRQWEPIALIFSSALIPYNLDRMADTYVQKIPVPQAQTYFRQGWDSWCWAWLWFPLRFCSIRPIHPFDE